MPLIIITGLPSSGKTIRANQLKDQLEKKISDTGSAINIVLINDELLSISKDTYRERETEKATRGAQISAVKRALGKHTIVILDNMTYIKGFRYQLFCEAKALSTNCCVVQIGAPKELCQQWNDNRESPWAQDLFEALMFRYEEPNPMARWDSPLFPISYEDKELPVDEIWETLVLQKPKPPNQATVLKPAPPGNYLTELDKITIGVVNEILDMQKTSPGCTVKLSDYEVPFELPMRLTLPEMNRIRRNFVSLNRMKPMDISRIRARFVEFVVKNLNVDI
jgi:protein KTI12